MKVRFIWVTLRERPTEPSRLRLCVGIRLRMLDSFLKKTSNWWLWRATHRPRSRSRGCATDSLSRRLELLTRACGGAIKGTKNKKIGVIGTEATIQSGAYTRALKESDSVIEVYSGACPLFVPLVEEGWTDNEVAEMTVKAYLSSLKQSGIDTLILGCTHYPLLKQAIRNFMGNTVRLVDSAEETAKEVEAALQKDALIRKSGNGVHSFFVTDAPDRFIKVGRRFLGETVESAVRIER
jgi:glutamate racemase